MNFNKPAPAVGFIQEYELFTGKNGTYDVTLTLEGSGKVSLLYDSRRFILVNEEISGTREISFTASLCDKKFHGCDYEEKRVLTAAVFGNARIISAEVAPADRPTIYITGDSTVTDQSADYPYNPHSTYCGWGQMLPSFFKGCIAVSNHAQSGLSTKTHFESNHTVLEKRVKSGDYLFIQFGHNDQKLAELDAFGGYTANITRLVEFSKERGAKPILCTPINRIIFEPDGSLKRLLDDYAEAVRRVGATTDTPVIDLHRKTTNFFTSLGEPDSWAYFWSDGETRDYTHTNDIGGDIIARFVAQGIYDGKIYGLDRYIREERLKMPPPIQGYKSNARIQNPLSNVGLVNIPADLDRDI